LKSITGNDSVNRINISNGSLIAVSYEARAKGVKRIMRGLEAKAACPDLILVQVPTNHGKADLKIYRDASANILQTLSKRYPNAIIERALMEYTST
jgi:DNA polymerase eta